MSRRYPARIGDLTVDLNGAILVVRRTDFKPDRCAHRLGAVHGSEKAARQCAGIIAEHLSAGASIDATRDALWEPMTSWLRHFTYSHAEDQRKQQLEALIKVFGAAAAWQADGAAWAAHAKKLAGAR